MVLKITKQQEITPLIFRWMLKIYPSLSMGNSLFTKVPVFTFQRIWKRVHIYLFHLYNVLLKLIFFSGFKANSANALRAENFWNQSSVIFNTKTFAHTKSPTEIQIFLNLDYVFAEKISMLQSRDKVEFQISQIKSNWIVKRAVVYRRWKTAIAHVH